MYLLSSCIYRHHAYGYDYYSIEEENKELRKEITEKVFDLEMLRAEMKEIGLIDKVQ